MRSTRVHRVSFFTPEPQAIKCLSYDKKNYRLAVSRSDSSIELWDLKENPYLEKVIPGTATSSVETLSWCNGRLFSAGLYGSITEHDLVTLQPKYQLIVTSGCPVWCMKGYKDKCLAVGNEDGHVVLHQLSSEGLDFEKKFDKQEGSILCMDWHRDGHVIVTGSIDAIRTWNTDTGHVVNRILLGRASKNTPTIVWCIAITSDMTIISGDSCGKTSFWDGNTGTLLSAIGSYKDVISDILTLSMNEDEDVMYASGVDPTITMFMKGNGKWLTSIQRVVHTHDVRALQLAGDFLVSGGDDFNLVFTKYPPKTTVTFFPFCQKSYTVATSEPSCILLQYPNYLEIWSLVKSSCTNTSGSPTHLLRVKPKENEKIISSSISSNGKWLAYSTQLQIRLFCVKMEINSSTMPAVYKVTLPKQIPSTSNILLFTSEPTKLILYAENKIYVVKCDSMQPIIEATIEETSDSFGKIHLMELSSNNSYLACGGHDGNILIYNLDSLKVSCKLPLYKCQPTTMKFDPTSENLIVVYSDRKVVEYNLQKLGYSSWSKQQWLLDFQKAAYYPIISMCFLFDKLYLQDENTIYIFDRTEIFPPEMKRIKTSEDDFSTVNEYKYQTITKYQHISSIHSCMEDLVVIIQSADHILKCLPPPLWKKKFGT